MTRRDLLTRCSCLLAVLAVTGCDEAKFTLAPVHGTVTLDGQPLKQGKVMFAPIRSGSDLEAGKPAFGLILPDGSFELSTYSQGDGAVVGDHWVTVFGSDDSTSAVSLIGTPKQSAAPTPFDRLNVTTKQTVKFGNDNQIEIALTTADIAKFSVRAD
jgi:hypothetical protein